MDKVGCNHLIIAGLLESENYAKADFLSMHLEQHLQFTIERQGRLKSQWSEYYETQLVPLEITSDAIKDGETIVYTREGRAIGGFDEFKDWAKIKYNIDIDYPADRMKAISDVHVKRAQGAIDDANTASFDEKVNALLQNRETHIRKTQKELDAHKAVYATVTCAIKELEAFNTTIQPSLDVLYALHHYPVKEEVEEEEKNEEKNDGEADPDTEAEADAEAEPAAEEAPEEPVKEEEPQQEEAPQEEEKEVGEEEEEKAEKPKEEEEEPEPDAEAVEAQSKLQEELKWPALAKCHEAIEKLKDGEVNLTEFVEDIEARVAQCTQMIAAEKFRWKKTEAAMLELKEKVTVMANMLTISILSAEDLQIKAIEEEIDNYDNFVIKDVDEELLEAAAIKFAATFQFA